MGREPSFAYFLTFVLTGASWMQHHVLLYYVSRVTRSFALLILVFLMFVSLRPFSTSLFMRYGSQQVGLAAYFGNQFVPRWPCCLPWSWCSGYGGVPGSAPAPRRPDRSAPAEPGFDPNQDLARSVQLIPPIQIARVGG